MRKYWFIGLFLFLAGCEEANDIFDWDDYSGWNSIEGVLEGNLWPYYNNGPVYIDATSWGSVAYVSDTYVNKGVKLLISESSDAEGGKVLDVTSNAIVVNDLNLNTQYYYCLYIPSGNIKSNIYNVVVPDVSALELETTCVGDSVKCVIKDSINLMLIEEKGFKLESSEDTKVVIDGNNFAFSIEEIVKKYKLTDASTYLYAYVQTANAYHRSNRIEVQLDSVSSDDVDNNINQEDIIVSTISEETIEQVDYLKCTVTGYMDSVYFYKEWRDDPENRLYPDITSVNNDGSTTFYLRKRCYYRDVQLKVFYKQYYYEKFWDNSIKQSEAYTPTQFNIRTLDDFFDYVCSDDHYHNNDELAFTLLADITLPSDLRLSIPLSGTLDGNGHIIDGVSFFPLFRTEVYSPVVRNLKIGRDKTIFDVKEGTNSTNTSNTVPEYLLISDYYDVTFENCEVHGTIRVTGRDNFDLLPDIPSGLKDYTKTEYVTTNN